MKKILLRIAVIVSSVYVVLEYAGVYLQSKKDLMIENPEKFDAMMKAVHTGTYIKTVAAWIAIAALACWIVYRIACIVGLRRKDSRPA